MITPEELCSFLAVSFLDCQLDFDHAMCNHWLLSMVTRSDLIKDTYLCLTTTRLGYPAGVIGAVHIIGTDWSGNWYFQLRWLNKPVGKRSHAVSEWSLNFREHDLEHFERIDTWEQVQKQLNESQPSGKPRRRAPRLPRYWRGKRHPSQLRLFEDS